MKSKKCLTILLSVTLAFSTLMLAGCGEEKKESSSSVFDTEPSTEAPKELSLPISSDEALKMDPEELYDLFYSSGFKATETEGLYDLDSSDDKQNNVIKTVMVDGHESFKKGDKVMSDAKIFIRYHSVKTEFLPVDSFDLEDESKELYYEDVITQLENKGFQNISTRTVEDSSKTEGRVKDITVDGESVVSDFVGSAPVDAKIVVVYYSNGKGNSKTESKSEDKPESKTASQTESKSNDSDAVSPDFKETMDSYEAWFDEYIDFMKRYKENPSDLNLINEYSQWLSDYSDYYSKLNNVDQNSLSAADLAYYLEVQSRITKKLTEIY